MSKHLCLSILLLCIGPTKADNFEDVATQWIKREFFTSSLSVSQQLDELHWFYQAAQAYRGMEIHVLSETITTHQYESKVLTRAFFDITGIRVIHDLKPEGEVVDILNRHLHQGEHKYQAFINDSDLIGTHYRYNKLLSISDLITGPGKQITLPTLALDDFIGLSFTTGPDGKIYQLPDQQFANLYWFRADWFNRETLKQQFLKIYSYPLGVPLNWSAYEDIAEFFTVHVKEIDGQKVYGHMDYGKKDPSLGWRFTDAWFSMAGAGDRGLPNGRPVDEWGIRVDGCHPVGSSVSRGGATNGPAAEYATRKLIEWLYKYAPPAARNMNFSQAGPVPAQGNIAQQIFWYTAFTADMTAKGLPVVDKEGKPKWRMAPSPRGPYWQNGMKLGYQDAGSWTFLRSTQLKQLQAAWLYAQFVVSKTVSLRKTLVGLTPIRLSDINSDAFTQAAPLLGGLVEFYRSPARIQWTPTGLNVPDYPNLAPLWWSNLAPALQKEISPQQALDNLAKAQDQVLARLQKSGRQTICAPRLNPIQDPGSWLTQPGSPKARLKNEKPKGKTIPYQELIKSWQ